MNPDELRDRYVELATDYMLRFARQVRRDALSEAIEAARTSATVLELIEKLTEARLV